MQKRNIEFHPTFTNTKQHQSIKTRDGNMSMPYYSFYSGWDANLQCSCPGDTNAITCPTTDRANIFHGVSCPGDADATTCPTTGNGVHGESLVSSNRTCTMEKAQLHALTILHSAHIRGHGGQNTLVGVAQVWTFLKLV